MTVPCTGAVPTWGASVGTGPRPSGLEAPWACRRRQTQMHACSRTLQVELGDCFVTAVPLGAVQGQGGLAVCAEPSVWALAEPRASRVPSSDEEVVEEPQNRRTRMSLGTKGLKVNLFPGLSPSALKVPSDHSADAHSRLASRPPRVQPFSSLPLRAPPHPVPPLIPLNGEGPAGSCAVC